eukprot:657961-Amphidinium_carterae.3
MPQHQLTFPAQAAEGQLSIVWEKQSPQRFQWVDWGNSWGGGRQWSCRRGSPFDWNRLSGSSVNTGQAHDSITGSRQGQYELHGLLKQESGPHVV